MDPVSGIPAAVQDEILRRIRSAEVEHRVRVLLAVESGSRAWGFESPNSDYDARFVYVHLRNWYLSIDDRRDVIEYPIVDEIDLNGWELRKALRLFRSSNPAFVEWIQSPMVYAETGSFASACREMLPLVYSCERGIHHYRSMARTNYRGYLRADLVPLKKYFYVLRPLLSVRWLETYATPAPIEFARLLHLVEQDSRLTGDIHRLLEQKRAAPEMGLAPRVPGIQDFVEAELDRIDSIEPGTTPVSPDVNARLNELFVHFLNAADP